MSSVGVPVVKDLVKGFQENPESSRLDYIGLNAAPKIWLPKSVYSQYITKTLILTLWMHFTAVSKSRKKFRLLLENLATYMMVVTEGKYRFQDKYARQKMAELWFLNELQPTAFLTLTFDPKKYGISLENPLDDYDILLEIWDESHKRWHKLNRMLQKKGIKPEYWCVWEAQKNGFPHLHVVFYTNHDAETWKYIAKYWTKHFGEIIKLYTVEDLGDGWVSSTPWCWDPKNNLMYPLEKQAKTYRQGNQVFKYVAKYMMKDAPLMQQMMMNATGKRSYSLSSGIRALKREHMGQLKKNKGDQQWRVLEKFHDPKGEFPDGTQLTVEQFKENQELKKLVGRWMPKTVPVRCSECNEMVMVTIPDNVEPSVEYKCEFCS